MRRSTAPRATLARMAVCLAATAILAACEPTYTTHGFTPQLDRLQSVEAGADTRGSVLRKLGRPSTVGSFDASTWYYIASTMERFAFYEPEVVDRMVVSVQFDEEGLVTAVNRYGLEDGEVIALTAATTPTHGRELTVLQQIFGNIGNVDAGQVLNNQ